MIQFDVPVTIGIGSLFAHAVRDRVARADPAAYSDGLVQALYFHLFANSWPPLLLLSWQFGLETSHMWWHADSVGHYPTLTAAFDVVLAASLLLGYSGGIALLRRGRTVANRRLHMALFGLGACWVLLQPKRTLTLGTYQNYLDGTAPWLWQDVGFLGFVVALVVVWSLALRALYLRARRDAG